MRFPRITLPFVCVVLLVLPSVAQSPNGNINGLVLDPTNQLIVGAEVIAVNDVTGVQYTTKTNNVGVYVLPNLPPGPYRIQISKVGFKTIIKPDIVLNVQDALSINFTLPIGAVLETVTITGGAPLVNTESATVSTVVDRQFAENLPMNGRSFQTLIQLTPGVVLTASNASDSGQFSINGQRASSNYWMVDGVSANIGIGVNVNGVLGNGLAGAAASFSALGGTNSLVSVDAMQEFRIQTSSYAPEFGRTPGGQVSIVTRSGTNQFHGTVFDYVRNDILDANNWFNGYTNSPPLSKAEERQNDFGGTLGGPILKNKAFLFFSYEGLRLRLPQTTLTDVPDLTARLSAVSSMRPYLNAFPLPNGLDNLATGIAEFNGSYSNPASLDAYSLRLDDKLGKKVNLFGRYSYSPSSIIERGNGSSLNTISPIHITTQTATFGLTWVPSPTVANELRFNYSRADATGSNRQDNFGGAVPLTSLPFPTPYTSANSFFFLHIFNLQDGLYQIGQFERNQQRQINAIETLSVQKGTHSLKLGLDFRRLSPQFDPYAYTQQAYFHNVASAASGTLLFSTVGSNLTESFLFRNLGIYAQDTWRATSRLTLTYGLRWDVDFVPRSTTGPSFPAVVGFNLENLSNLALAPSGTPPYTTTFGNFAPRIGGAYQLRKTEGFQTVLRGGFGVFYDLASSEMGNNVGIESYPFGSSAFTPGGTFPLAPPAAVPPPISAGSLASSGVLSAFNPNLKLPYSLEWNLAIEQEVGKQQSISASYIGAAGRRLLQTAEVFSPNPSFFAAQLITNAGTSDYDALQVQFQRRLSAGLQALASYTWSHSFDTGSAGSTMLASNALVPSQLAANRGPSDFDIRSAVSAGVTYDIPTAHLGRVASVMLQGWAVENLLIARTAPPVDVSDANFSELANGFYADVRPDLVPGQAVYLFGPRYPGNKAFNPAAFMDPPVNPATQLPIRQGNAPRNFLRGFGAAQWDFAVHRDFPIHESIKLQFRAELFNVLNHPNFGPPNGQFGTSQFGLSAEMLGQSLNNQNLGGGALSPLYQIGGPRSIQFALKLLF